MIQEIPENIRQELEEEATTQLNSDKPNNFKTVYQECRDYQSRICICDNVRYIILGAISSWDPYGGDLYYFAISLIDIQITLLHVNQQITLEVGLSKLEESSIKFELSSYAYNYWLKEFNEEKHDDELQKLVKDYLQDHPTDYMFTPIMLPNQSYSISIPYDDEFKHLPHIYLNTKHSVGEIRRIIFGLVDPIKYKLDYNDSLFEAETSSTTEYLTFDNEFKSRFEEEDEKIKKYYMLSEEEMMGIKEFCGCECLLVGTKNCESCKIRNLLK